MSAAGNVWPRLPLEGATKPHPDGLRIAQDVYPATLLYPKPEAGERTQAEADAQAKRVREAMDKAVAVALEPTGSNPASEREAAALDELAGRLAATENVGKAAGDALREALGPPALTDEEDRAAFLLSAYLGAYLKGYWQREAEEAKPKKTRPQGPAAVGTYPELAVIGFAAADGRTGDHWQEAPGGGALVHNRMKAGLQVRFQPSVGGDRWADPVPGALPVDLFGILSAYGGLDAVFLAQVCADLAVEHEHEEVSLDDLGRLIGRDPRTTKDRQAMRRDLWGTLKFLDGITVWGARKGTYRDPSTRKEVPIESRDPLFLISGAMWPKQATLDGTDVPLKVNFGAGPLLATYRGRPAVLTTFGEYRRLAAIPGEKPSGAWARSMGLALTQRWRELASYGKRAKLTRRYLLAQFPPAPTAAEVLAGHDPARARRYFTQALALLRTHGIIAAYSEPDPTMLPRTGWGAVWLGQTVDVTQPDAVLEAGEGIEATREEAETKAARGHKRRA